ncbi:MAG: YvcK family protein [Candidatus Nomurabacteria bacterium]|nr:YvcK family protein [Candidatus Nomurabacteria bacterium]
MKNIVTVGGGTGSYTVLSGLKNLPDVSLTALVSMADDGGSTGMLRDELGVLPPGDVRQCLVALSEHSDVVRELMNYHFENGGLSGHSFGNIFLAALEKVTGNFGKGVEIASEILKIKGKVIPITDNSANLSIELSNGKIIGEDNIQNADLQKYGLKKISYETKVSLNKRAKKSILNADVIILGPGNYYCSVLPNLIVNGFKETIKKSKAKIIFPVNLTNKLKHTSGWKVSDYVADIEKYLGKKVDYILVNNQKPSAEQTKHYELEEGTGVLIEDDFDDERVIRAKLLSTILFKPKYDKQMKATRGFIRHDSEKLSECIKKIIDK